MLILENAFHHTYDIVTIIKMTCLEFIEGETFNEYFMRCITPFREDPYPLPKCHVSWHTVQHRGRMLKPMLQSS